MSSLHAVFGTGAVGMAVMEALVRRGYRVRMVNRSGHASVPSGVEVVGGDASDPGFSRQAATGAGVLYQCLNPPYHRWVELFPALQAGVLAAAESTEAKLVVMENVYMYGLPQGRPLTEDRPYDAHTKKGRLRARMTNELLDAHRRGVRITIGRASDYFGPRGGAQSILGDRVIPPALAGKPAQLLGNPDLPHTYTYIPDIGEALVLLGERDEALGQPWHLPNPETLTTRQLVDLIYQQAGHPLKLRVAPKLLLRLMGLFDPTVRELVEMAYEFEEPFIVDSTKFQTKLGMTATPIQHAIAQTVEWYQRRAADRA
jgi:nucleoside-diphosphate-sugar epimerase